MFMRCSRLRAAAAFAVVAFSLVALPADTRATDGSPVVVELFTSQGCNSCPPADALLGELADREGVLPLSFHVTYWDRLGWPDTFGLEAATARQEDYAQTLGARGLYTPQMVIGGLVDAVGSDRTRVLRAIDILEREGPAGPPIEIGQGEIRVGAGSDRPATVVLVTYDTQHEVDVARGENRGRTLTYTHVVRGVIELGPWDGDEIRFPLSLDGLRAEDRGGVAVLVQRDGDGAILSAAVLDLRPS